jgi:hypothetical protein
MQNGRHGVEPRSGDRSGLERGDPTRCAIGTPSAVPAAILPALTVYEAHERTPSNLSPSESSAISTPTS